MQFFGGLRGTKTTMLCCIMRDHWKRNFRHEMREVFIEGNLRHNCYLDLGNISNKFSNHCFNKVVMGLSLLIDDQYLQ